MPRTTAFRSLAPALLAGVLVVLAGCNGEEEAPAAAEAPAPAETGAEAARSAVGEVEPCSLLTADEIERATGVVPDAGQTVAGACAWAAADGSNSRLLNVTVLHGDVTRERWLAIGGSEEDIVEGVGDFAVRVGSQLQVFQGGVLVGVTVRGSERPDADRELARAVHDRLAG